MLLMCFKKPDPFAAMFVQLQASINDEKQRERLVQRKDLANASVRSVIALTEYEDGKIARILTVVAFLSAIVGAVFTRFQTLYALPARPGPWGCLQLAYISFAAYIILISAAAALLIWAIRPKFTAPKSWRSAATHIPTSIFFFQKILDVSSDAWAKYWVSDDEFEARAVANDVAEAYLVAHKVAQKLQIAKFGVGTLIIGMIFLVLFFVSVSIVFATVAPSTSGAVPAATPTTSPLLQSHNAPSPQAGVRQTVKK